MDYRDIEHLRAQDLIKQVVDAHEKKIVKGLNDLISRGLLVVKVGEMQMVMNSETGLVQASHSVEIKLRDQEYIDSLEQKVAKLEQKISDFKRFVSDWKD